MANTFHGAIDAHIAIPAPQCGPGGTMNFNFGSDRIHGGQTHKPVPFSTVPFAPDPDFVNRPEIVAWVHDKCAGRGARAALVGLGGVGKSQLALQYAHSIRDASPQTFVFWVHASTHARFEEAYKDMAERLQLPGRYDPKANVLRLVSDWLRDETNGRWVMVVDNVDDVETFFPSRKRQRDNADASAQTPLATYLPQSRNGTILITSRSKEAAARLAGGHSKIKEVLAMSKGEGLQLLCSKLLRPPIEDSAMELLQALECIPLVITQAAAYMNRRTRMTIPRYLDEFRANNKKREKLLNWDACELRRDDSASNSVLTTWQMSFEQIRQERPSAAELLSLMSFFNPQGIPESTLRRYNREIVGAANAEDEEDADSRFDEDLDALQAYSLVSTTAKTDAYEMHALVQFCTRVWLSSFSDIKHWKHKFAALMAKELPNAIREDWTTCQQLLPHVQSLLHTKPAAEQLLMAWAQLMVSVALYLIRTGSFNTAQQVAEKALDAIKRALGIDDTQTLHSVAVPAAVLHSQDKFKEVETLFRQALEGHKKKLGEQHPDTLVSMCALLSLLYSWGKSKEAETPYQQALEKCRKQLEEQHADTSASLSNLARVMQDLRKYEEAETLYRQALKRRKKKLGERHPDTPISTHLLVDLLYTLHRCTEARRLCQQACDGP